MAASASADAAALDRVLMRVAGTDEAALEAVLDKLLPLVIAKLGTPDPAVRGAALKILSHVNARVAARSAGRTLGLPLLECAKLAGAATSAPLVGNTALMYVDQAVRAGRPDPAARAAALPHLARGAASRPPAQRDTALRLAIGGLAGWRPPREVKGGGAGDAAAVADFWLADPADRAALLAFGTDVMLFRPPTLEAVGGDGPGGGGPGGGGLSGMPPAPSINTPLGAALAAAAAAAGAAAPTRRVAPPGLSLAAADRVMGGEAAVPPPATWMASLKAGLLEWASAPPSAPGGLAAVVGPAPAAAADARRACVLWALIASSEGGGGGGGLAGRGEEILRRRALPAIGGAPREEDPLEDEALASAVLDLVVGHHQGGGAGQTDPVPDPAPARTPPSPSLTARALALLCRSRAAAGAACFPAAAAAIEAAVFARGRGRRPPAAVVQAGAEFCVWVLRHAPADVLAPAAPAILHRLLDLLEGEGEEEGEEADSAPQPMVEDGAGVPAPPPAIASVGIHSHHHHHHHGPPPPSASPAARSFAWQALGQLATRVPGALAARPDVAARLFTALAAEPDGVRAAAQEAVACVATAYAGVAAADPAAADELCSLLTQAVAAPAEAVRVCAAVWAGRLFPRGHVRSRWVCVLAAGDGRLAVREAGEAGLSVVGIGGASSASAMAARSGGAAPPAAKRPKGSSGDGGGEGESAAAAMAVDGEAADPDALPPVASVLATARAEVPALARPPPSAATVAAGGGELPLPATAFAALLRFCRACRAAEGGAGGSTTSTAAALLGPHSAADAAAAHSPSPPPPDEFLDLVDLALAASDAPGGLRRDALDALLAECAAGHAGLVGARYAPRLGLSLRPHLAHTDPGGRGVAAKLVSVAAGALPPPERAALLASLTEVASGGAAHPSRPGSAAAKGTAAAASSGGPARFEARDGAAAAAGTVLAALAADAPPPPAAAAAVSALTALLAEAPHAASAATALGHAGLGGPLPGGDDAASAVVAGLASLVAGKEPAAAAAAAVALGRLAGGDPARLPAAIDALLAVAAARAPSPPESVVLAAGEGLVWALGGHGVPPGDVLAGPFVSLAARSVVVAAAADGESSSSPLPPVEAAPPPPAVAAARERVLTALTTDLAVSPTPAARAAGCAWLVSLLTCAPSAAAVRAAAAPAQAVFLALLADPDELIQDAAPRGLCACYALAEVSGPDSAGGGRADLLAGLADALAGGGGTRARATIKKGPDSKVDGLLVTAQLKHGEGHNGSAPAGASSSAPASLATMRELASLASDMGQPDLVYRFAALTARAAALRSSRGAALGMASLAALPGGAAALAPLVAKLTPRLVRGLHDPHPAVRDAMTTIWAALVPDPAAAIDGSRPRIAADLVADAGGKEARVREAALAALADLVGRPAGPAAAVDAGWSGLGPSSPGPALDAALRCADDVKPSVRAAGVGLARALRSAALRACDAAGRSGSPASSAAAADALATLLPALTSSLASPAADVRALALDGLAALAGGAPPAILAPLLPSILPPVLESLSGGSETGVLNYVDSHLAAAGEGAGEGARAALEDARLAAARSGKAATILDAAVAAVAGAGEGGGEAVAGIIPPLVAAIKRGVGSSTRAGAARLVASLAGRVPAAHLAPAAGKLMAALLAGARSDAPGGAVRRLYASSAASLLKVAPPAKAAAFIESLTALVPPGGGEAADRELAGAFALACARGAADAWTAAGGPGAFLPRAAVWRHDPDAAGAAAWASLWDETAPGGGAAVRLYGADLASTAAAALGASAWGSKAAAAKAVCAAAAAADAIAPHAAALADRLRAELGAGRYYEGKADLAKALGALAAAAPAAADGRACADALAAVLARPGSRPELKSACLAALAAAAPALPPADVSATAAPALSTGLGLYAARRAAEAAGEAEPVVVGGGADAGDADAAPAVRPAPIASLLAALPPVWAAAAAAPPAALAALTPPAAAGVAAALAAGVAWDVRVAACSSVVALAAGVPAGGAAAALAAWASSLGEALAGAAGEPKHVAVRCAAADALGALAAAGLAPAGSPPALALDKLAGSDASDTVKARAAAAKAKAVLAASK